MAEGKKAKARTDQTKGKIKKSVGHAIGDDELESEGRGDQAKGDLREAGEKAKDAVKDVLKD